MDSVDCDTVCAACTRDDPSDYLDHLRNNPHAAETLGIDLAEHGYTLHVKDQETGFHPGQNADPRKVLANLKAQGFTDIVFRIDGAGQFDITWSAWVREADPEDESD
jgi:hypothetical protein